MLIDGFTEVGDSQLLLVEELLTYNEAKTQCEGLTSNLVEFWNEQEWNEVTLTLQYRADGVDGPQEIERS